MRRPKLPKSTIECPTCEKGGGFPLNAVLGLTRDFSNHVWFAWSAGTDNNFPRPHVEMVTLNADANEPPNLSVNQQVQIWNSTYTFAYPALALNACSAEIGFSLEGGGDGNYENHLVGFWGGNNDALDAILLRDDIADREGAGSKALCSMSRHVQLARSTTAQRNRLSGALWRFLCRATDDTWRALPTGRIQM